MVEVPRWVTGKVYPCRAVGGAGVVDSTISGAVQNTVSGGEDPTASQEVSAALAPGAGNAAAQDAMSGNSAAAVQQVGAHVFL